MFILVLRFRLSYFSFNTCSCVNNKNLYSRIPYPSIGKCLSLCHRFGLLSSLDTCCQTFDVKPSNSKRRRMCSLLCIAALNSLN